MADRTRYRGCLAGCSLLALWILWTPPSHAQAANDTLTRATALLRAGQYDAAIAAIEPALRADPSNPRLHTVEGVAYSMKGDDAKALEALRAALKVKPDFPAALKAEAEILTREHSPEAAPVLLQILKQAPGDSIAREMLAVEQARAGDCGSAVTNFKALASAVDRHPSSLLQYGVCLFEEKQFDAAAPVFAQLSKLQPARPEIRYDLALAEQRAGQNQAAADALAPLLNQQADTETLSLASDVFEAIGDTPRAIALLRQAIVRQPEDSDSYVRFAELCMLHESYQAGVAMVSAGIARLPQSSSLYLARGMLYGGEGEYDKAEADFRAAEVFDPKHGTGAYGVGLVQAQRNDPAQALATTRSALRAHPEDPRLNFLLARLLIEGGEHPGSAAFAEATACAEKAVRLSPDLVAARNLLAKIYTLSGQTAQAIEQCRAALKIDPSDQTAMYRLLMASRKIGDSATAEELAKRLAEEHQRARNDESNRLRYRVVEASGPNQPPDAHAAGSPQP
jgi:tetratricopeptide (TPR) repeat protein